MDTGWPSKRTPTSQAASVVLWTNTSRPKSSLATNPKPRASSNHLTLPVKSKAVDASIIARRGDRHLETLGPDGIFGEMALIDDSPRSATVVALTDVTLAPIKENQFLFLVQNTPFFALSVMRVLASRLRRQNKLI